MYLESSAIAQPLSEAQADAESHKVLHTEIEICQLFGIIDSLRAQNLKLGFPSVCEK